MAKVVDFDKSNKASKSRVNGKGNGRENKSNLQAKNSRKKLEITPEELEKAREKLKNKDRKINLAELVNSTVDFIRGDITADEFAKVGDKIVIRDYIPILDKYRIMAKLIFNMNQNTMEQEELMIVGLEKDLFFEVLLGEYALVDVSDDGLQTYYNYDLLYPIFMPYILQYCYVDYQKLVNMINKSLDLAHIKELSKILDSVDYNELKQRTKENRELMESLEKNKELVANLKEILKTTNPMSEAIIEGVKGMALDEANKVVSENRGLKEAKDGEKTE